MNRTYAYIGGGVVIAIALIWAVWYLFFTGTSVTELGGKNTTQFAQSDNRTGVTAQQQNTNQPLSVASTPADSSQKIFKLSDGPVASATLINMLRPTTTVARFVMADSGHIYDLALDSPGAVAKAISNTTIPGITAALWSEGGRGALLQYLDQGSIKTAHFALPAVGSTTPPKVQFLQTGAWSLAVSPDGAGVAYLLKTGAGADGYIAKADGSGAKRLFSMPLSQLLLSWPAAGTLLLQSAPAAGVLGGVFAVDNKSGGVSPLLFADGITATADRLFNNIIYQTAGGGGKASYALNPKTGSAKPLSFDPLPEQCLFSTASSTTLYCAAPLQYVSSTYGDDRRAGLSSAPEGIFAYNVSTARITLVATPGGSDGGESADIASLSLSPNDHYLLYIRRGDRSLWGVRLK